MFTNMFGSNKQFSKFHCSVIVQCSIQFFELFGVRLDGHDVFSEWSALATILRYSAGKCGFLNNAAA